MPATNADFTRVGASHGILPHVANIDNRSATVLICKCSLLCNNIPIATHTRNSTAPSLLWYGLVNSAQQRTAFSNDPTGVLYWVRLKASRERYVVETSFSTTTWTSADTKREQDLQGSSAASEEAQTDCIASVNKVVQQLISRIVVWLYKSYIRIGKLLHSYILANKPYIIIDCNFSAKKNVMLFYFLWLRSSSNRAQNL
jgi:hypothetical protein